MTTDVVAAPGGPAGRRRTAALGSGLGEGWFARGRIALGSLALWLILPGLARAAPVEALLARVEKASAQVDTLSGAFTQKSRVKLFRQELSSTGRLYFQRPRRIRWEYLQPDPSTLVLDGDRATLRSPGAPPQTFDLARDAAMRAVFDQLTLWLGGGSLSGARDGYDLAAEGSDAQPVLVLVPRAGAPASKTFARIELRFDARLLLKSILLREVSGDEKEVTFPRLERNARLPADAFSP